MDTPIKTAIALKWCLENAELLKDFRLELDEVSSANYYQAVGEDYYIPAHIGIKGSPGDVMVLPSEPDDIVVLDEDEDKDGVYYIYYL